MQRKGAVVSVETTLSRYKNTWCRTPKGRRIKILIWAEGYDYVLVRGVLKDDTFGEGITPFTFKVDYNHPMLTQEGYLIP